MGLGLLCVVCVLLLFFLSVISQWRDGSSTGRTFKLAFEPMRKAVLMVNVIAGGNNVRAILAFIAFHTAVPLFELDLGRHSILLRYVHVLHAYQTLEPSVRRLCEHLWGYFAVVIVLLGVHLFGDEEPRPTLLLNKQSNYLQDKVEHEESAE